MLFRSYIYIYIYVYIYIYRASPGFSGSALTPLQRPLQVFGRTAGHVGLRHWPLIPHLPPQPLLPHRHHLDARAAAQAVHAPVLYTTLRLVRYNIDIRDL